MRFALRISKQMNKHRFRLLKTIKNFRQNKAAHFCLRQKMNG